MKRECFLANRNDPSNDAWWERFCLAEQFARKCLGTWPMGTLNEVRLSPDKTQWIDCGLIEVTEAALSDGSLYHELFHVIHHHAPFKRKAEVKGYGFYNECLCHAFEYFMELAIGPEGNWFRRVNSWDSLGWPQILERSGSPQWDWTNGLPTVQIVRDCGSFEGFMSFYHTLNTKL